MLLLEAALSFDPTAFVLGGRRGGDFGRGSRGGEALEVLEHRRRRDRRLMDAAASR